MRLFFFGLGQKGLRTMANTVFVRGGAHSASVEEIWGEKTWRQAQKDSFFSDGKFVGESSNNIVQVNVDLTKNKGDRINTPLRTRLISDGKGKKNHINQPGQAYRN